MEAMLGMLKMLLEIDDTTQDALLELVLQSTVDKVQNYTRLAIIPLQLYGVVAEMAADAYYLLLSARGEDSGKVAGTVSSVSDNGQSVSYRDNSYNAVLVKAAEHTLKNYQAQLERWRKVGW
ncbi:MAG: phage head-tail connector protein [Candidatus Pelethousia sp.]|nr:phage head-tail connector protein [Candidatus Pelethousia sp.]